MAESFFQATNTLAFLAGPVGFLVHVLTRGVLRRTVSATEGGTGRLAGEPRAVHAL